MPTIDALFRLALVRCNRLYGENTTDRGLIYATCESLVQTYNQNDFASVRRSFVVRSMRLKELIQKHKKTLVARKAVGWAQETLDVLTVVFGALEELSGQMKQIEAAP